jgi:hypothetical protein
MSFDIRPAVESSNPAVYEHQKSRFLVFLVFAFFALLRYLVQFEALANLVATIIAVSPFLFAIAFAIWLYFRDKKDHVLYEKFQQYDVFLKSFFKLALAMLILFVMFFPAAWEPVFIIIGSFFRFISHLSVEMVFLVFSYVGIFVIIAFTIDYLIRLYQKSTGAYQGSMKQLTKKLLYNAFFIFLFLLVFSAFAFPQAYTSMASQLTGGPNSAIQTSLSQLFLNTGRNVFSEIFATNAVLKKSLGKVSNQVAQSINTTTTSMAAEVRSGISSTGGDISGNLNVFGELNADGGIIFADSQEFNGATLQELSYLKGVKSSIQNQLDEKLSALSYAAVNIGGDTMTGKLNLPVNGLAVGGDQLIVKNGNVGIDTSNPGVPLQIGDLLYVGKDGEANFHLGAEAPSDYMFYIKETRDTNGPFVLEGADGAVIRMDTFGDNTNFDNVKDGGNLYIGRDMNGGGFLQFANTMTLPVSGSGHEGMVGINTESPDAPLEIFGGGGGSPTLLINSDSNDSAGLNIRTDGYNWEQRVAGSGNGLGIEGGSLYFTENGVNGMVLRRNGNFGIGTTLPQSALSVNSHDAMTDLMDLQVNGSSKFIVDSTGNVHTRNIILGNVGATDNVISSYGGFAKYVNVSGGLATGGEGSVVSDVRLTAEGNLTNIGSIQAGEMNLARGGTFAGKVDYSVGGSPVSVATGDLNGDGKADMVVANEGGGTVSVFINNGDGTFAEKVDYDAGGVAYFVTIGDLNGDGKPDLAVGTYYSMVVSVLFNNGDGTFTFGASYESGYSFAVSIADLNGDGKNDLAVANYTSNSLSVLMNNGDGTFAPRVDYLSTAALPKAIATSDLNGDGHIDVVIGNYNGEGVTVFINNGDGTFADCVYYSAPGGPFSVAIGDLNGDNKPDIVVTPAWANTIDVLINNGDGTFAPQIGYSAGIFPYSVDIADLNGDGKNDLVAASQNSNEVSVLIGRGDGTFDSGVGYPVGLNPKSVSAADFNGDGKADLAVANSASGDVSVLMNQAQSMFYAQASTGNIGIGTLTPEYKLDVRSMGVGPIARFISDNSTGCTISDGGIISCTSDVRLKKNIANTANGLESVLALRPVEYNWNSEVNGAMKSLGFIAQEVEQVLPGLVRTDGKGYKELNTIGMIPVLTRAIQEQQVQIAANGTQLDSLIIKTDQGVTTIKGLQTSIDQQLEIVSQSISDIDTRQLNQDEVVVVLQKQVAELETIVGSGFSTKLAQVDLNKQEIDYIKLVLGLDGTQDQGDVKLIGKLESAGIVSGAFTVRVSDKENKTVGQASIYPAAVDEDGDGIDDKTGKAVIESDGKSADIITKAVGKGSRIFTNFEDNPGAFSWTEKMQDADGNYTGFRIKLANPVEKEVKANWWILDEK